jgi:AcrR family transcriptional regulator
MKVLSERKFSAVSAASDGQNRSSPTRVEILDAAARLIVDGGYEAFTMRAVAQRVKIKAGSLYHHFNSKEEIVEEVLNRGIVMLLDQVQQQLAEVRPGARFAERIQVAIHAHLSCMLGRETVYMRVYEHLPPVLKRRSRAMRDKYAKFWFRLFEDGVREGDIDPDINLNLLVPYFLGGLNRVPEWFRPARGKSSDIAEIATRALLYGAGNRPSKSKSRAAIVPIRS